MQGAVMGPESDGGWFYTNASGLCPTPPPVPGRAKSNTFCRTGTFADVEEWKEPVHLFLAEDFVPVIAKNPFETYFKTYALSEDGFTPQFPIKFCWMIDNVDFFDPQFPENLPVDNPPPTPTAPPPPTPICTPSLGPNACVASGGTYFSQNQICQCP
jgi:hypothetical protein